MKKISIFLMTLMAMATGLQAAPPGQDELDLYGNQQAPNIESVPETDTGSTRFEPNRDVSDIPTTEITLSPTRSKTVTRTISRPATTPQQNPGVMDPLIAPMIYPGYHPYPPR